MNQAITNPQKCVVMRNGVELWLDKSLAAKLQAILENATEHKFITFEGRTINTADCTGVYLAQDMEAQARRKSGQWQCRVGTWHDKGEACNCQDEAERASRRQRAQEFHRQNGYYPLWF
jgi:hypothetical protein